MEINPHVLKLMREAAYSEAQFREWVRYHLEANAADVDELCEQLERDELADLEG